MSNYRFLLTALIIGLSPFPLLYLLISYRQENFSISSIGESVRRINYMQDLLYALARNTEPLLLNDNLVKCLGRNNSFQACAAKIGSMKCLRIGVFEKEWNALIVPGIKKTKYDNDSLVLWTDKNEAVVVAKIHRKGYYWSIEGYSDNDNRCSFQPLRLIEWNYSNIDINGRTVRIVENVELFHRQVVNTKFVECKTDLARKLRAENPHLWAPENMTIKPEFVETLVKIRDMFYGMNVFPMLFAGALLGWYRECGIIPHTKDFDFLIFGSEISLEMERTVRHQIENIDDCWFYRNLGQLREKDHDRYQLWVLCNRTRVDFFAYYNNYNKSWVGGAIEVRWVFPFVIRETDVCTCELHGHLFFIPCQVERILVTEYGHLWRKIRHTSRYSWMTSAKNYEYVNKTQ